MKQQCNIPSFSISLMMIFLLLIISCKKSENNGTSQNHNQTGTVTDIDGNIYRTVKIGAQIWMAENLKTTKFNNGTSIPLVTSDSIWWQLKSPGYCWYNNDEFLNKNVYGALYNWYAVKTGILAPIGWHVPTANDWQILVDILGNALVAGGPLKETDTIHWESPNTGATNSSGFCGLPGGHRDDGFKEIHKLAYFWTINEYDSSGVGKILLSQYVVVFENYIPKNFGLSVRCIKD